MSGNLESIFGKGGFDAKRDIPQEMSSETQVREIVSRAGLNLPPTINPDGEIHKFPIDASDKKLSGWYAFHKNSYGICGCAGNFKSDLQINAKGQERPLSTSEIEEQNRLIQLAKEKRNAAQTAAHLNTAKEVQAIWKNAKPVPLDHPYIKRKGLSSTHGAKLFGDIIILPMFDAMGTLWSFERIFPSGEKKGWKGGKRKGNFWLIGDPKESNQIIIAEGFATAVTIQEQTGCPVVVAYGAHGLVPVTGIIRDLFSDKTIIIASDNDENKVSQTNAFKAQKEFGCRVEISPLSEEGNDFNDFYLSGGDIKAIFQPPADPWLKSANDLISKPTYVKWLIKHWWQKDSLIMVHGPSGSGKTFLVLDMALHLATGQEDWNGYKIRDCPVVYLAGEGHYGIAQRLKGWSQEKGISEINNFWVSKSGTNLNTDEGLSFVTNQVNSLPVKPGLIIVDTLHRFLDGNEDSAVDAKTMIDSCDKLKELYGCSVLLVHHTGLSENAQERGRGSGSWKGAMENEINVQEDNQVMTIKPMKMKDGAKEHPIYMDMSVITIKDWFDDDDDPVTSIVLSPTEKAQKSDKKETKKGEKIKLFEMVWRKSGEELANDLPYVTRSALKAFFDDMGGKSERTIKNYLNPSHEGGFINYMIINEILQKTLAGWTVIDPVLSSAMLLSKKP